MHIVLVETTAVRGFDMVREMLEMGHEVSFVAQDLKRHFAFHGEPQMALASRLIEVPQLGQACPLGEILRDQLGANRPQGVICRDEVFARDVAHLTQMYGLPGESDATARLLSDKSAVRDRLLQAGVGGLRWRRVQSPNDALEFAREVGFPIVVKPTAGGFSVGVSIVQDEAGLAHALAEAARAYVGVQQGQAMALLEEFAPGKLVSAEMLVQHGQPYLLGFAERLPCPPGITAEIGGHFPAQIEHYEASRKFAKDVVRALGIQNSAVHMEMMITPKGPELVEVNGRVAGYVVTQQMSHALGRSITADLVALATGQTLAPFGEPIATVALRSLWSDSAGVVERIDAVDDLGPDVVMYGINTKPGASIRPLLSNYDRFGFVMALGMDAEDASASAALAAKRLQQKIHLVASATEPECAPTAATANETRTHVLLLDRIGPAGWTRTDGSPLLPPERYRLSILSSAGEQACSHAGKPDFIARMDVFDQAAVNQMATAVHAIWPVHKVATLSERLLIPAAKLRRRFDTIGDTPAQVNRFIDKAVMKQLARRANIACADGQVVHQPEDLLELFARHSRVIVKPRAASGSQGVAMFDTPEQAQAWLATSYQSGAFLAEGFVAGPMCHIDALVWDGEPIWDVSCYVRDTLAYTRGQPLSSATVADAGLRRAAEKLLRQVIAAWQVKAAVLHLEAFDSPQGLVFCEVAARPGGAGVVEAFEATRGINLDHAKILLDCQEDPRQLQIAPVAEHAGYTVLYCQAGRLEHYDDSIVAAKTYYKRIATSVGQPVPQSRFSGTGLSTHIFAASSRQEVLTLIEQAESGIVFRVNPI